MGPASEKNMKLCTDQGLNHYGLLEGYSPTQKRQHRRFSGGKELQSPDVLEHLLTRVDG